MKENLLLLYEFAMTPDLFDASVANTDGRADVILVEILRGIAENGLLANLHRDRWVRHVRDTRTPALSQALRDKVLSCLTVLHGRNRMVRHPKRMAGDPTTDMDWLNLALDSHQRIPFHAIVLSQSLIDDCTQPCDAFVEFFGSLDSAKWEARRQRTLSLTKCDADYRSALAPILRHARSLSLIDPYMNSQESRYFDTVKICSNLMGQRGHDRLPGRIHIHAEVSNQKPPNQSLTDYLDAWDQKLHSLIAADNHRFKVFLWESRPGSESMHDRFILTDQCGISAPGGLDCFSPSRARNTDWNLMDEDARRLRWDQYDPAMRRPSDLSGSREIS